MITLLVLVVFASGFTALGLCLGLAFSKRVADDSLRQMYDRGWDAGHEIGRVEAHHL